MGAKLRVTVRNIDVAESESTLPAVTPQAQETQDGHTASTPRSRRIALLSPEHRAAAEAKINGSSTTSMRDDDGEPINNAGFERQLPSPSDDPTVSDLGNPGDFFVFYLRRVKHSTQPTLSFECFLGEFASTRKVHVFCRKGSPNTYTDANL